LNAPENAKAAPRSRPERMPLCRAAGFRATTRSRPPEGSTTTVGRRSSCAPVVSTACNASAGQCTAIHSCSLRGRSSASSGGQRASPRGRASGLTNIRERNAEARRKNERARRAPWSDARSNRLSTDGGRGAQIRPAEKIETKRVRRTAAALQNVDTRLVALDRDLQSERCGRPLPHRALGTKQHEAATALLGRKLQAPQHGIVRGAEPCEHRRARARAHGLLRGPETFFLVGRALHDE